MASSTTSLIAPTIAHLGLGANLGAPRETIERALEALDRPELRVLRVSRLYRTAPVGPVPQPDFVNAAVEIETTLAPLALLEHAKAIERRLGRTEAVRWGPRLIDIDLLLYGAVCLSHPALTLPHPELHRRRFALAPLAELAPEALVPGFGTVRALLDALPAGGVTPLDKPRSRLDGPAR